MPLYKITPPATLTRTSNSTTNGCSNSSNKNIVGGGSLNVSTSSASSSSVTSSASGPKIVTGNESSPARRVRAPLRHSVEGAPQLQPPTKTGNVTTRSYFRSPYADSTVAISADVPYVKLLEDSEICGDRNSRPEAADVMTSNSTFQDINSNDYARNAVNSSNESSRYNYSRQVVNHVNIDSNASCENRKSREITATDPLRDAIYRSSRAGWSRDQSARRSRSRSVCESGAGSNFQDAGEQTVGESLIAREIREQREREQELLRLRQLNANSAQSADVINNGSHGIDNDDNKTRCGDACTTNDVTTSSSGHLSTLLPKYRSTQTYNNDNNYDDAISMQCTNEKKLIDKRKGRETLTSYGRNQTTAGTTTDGLFTAVADHQRRQTDTSTTEPAAYRHSTLTSSSGRRSNGFDQKHEMTVIANETPSPDLADCSQQLGFKPAVSSNGTSPKKPLNNASWMQLEIERDLNREHEFRDKKNNSYHTEIHHHHLQPQPVRDDQHLNGTRQHSEKATTSYGRRVSDTINSRSPVDDEILEDRLTVTRKSGVGQFLTPVRQSFIEREINEMRIREEELRRQRDTKVRQCISTS